MRLVKRDDVEACEAAAKRAGKDPAALQEVRQSDNTSNEKFWQAWKAFGVRAAEVCSAKKT